MALDNLDPLFDSRGAGLTKAAHKRTEAPRETASGSHQPNAAWATPTCRVMEKTAMLTAEDAQEFAKHWVEAWNSHNLDVIMSHYAADVVLVSPVAARILNDPSGTLKGREAVRAYFRRGLEAYPNLEFELIDVMWGLSSVVLYYVNQNGTKTGEFMEMDSGTKVIRVVANYNARI